MILKYTLVFLFVLVAKPTEAGSLSEDIEELIALIRLEEDIKNQYQECISGSANITEVEIQHEIRNEYSDIMLDSEDLVLLVSIYSEFYNYRCSYLSGDAVPNFYRLEFRKRFTHAEIKSLIEFYKTPLGLKLNNQWIEISKEYGKIIKDRSAVDSFEAQRRYENQMEMFWEHLERKAQEEPSEKGA
ncbi:MAG: DUF2059 domain-containing protein [Gammaproteobacteria bacterium]|nr:DUF2059 domain-containing protein [Gammaproteobacteria bacterium]